MLRLALEKADADIEDITFWEINEAFACVVIAKDGWADGVQADARINHSPTWVCDEVDAPRQGTNALVGLTGGEQ